MRFIIDTEMKRVIVPDNYYKKIDEMNVVLDKGGVAKDKQIDYVEFVKGAFKDAVENPLIRKSDISQYKK